MYGINLQYKIFYPEVGDKYISSVGKQKQPVGLKLGQTNSNQSADKHKLYQY